MSDQNEKALVTPTENTPKSLSSMGYFQPEMLEQALRVAEKFYKAGCFGADVKSPEQAFVKIQCGAEMGMPPMEAMNSLYIVNGKITIWGMALSKRLREHGWKIEYVKSTDTEAQVKITKGEESYEYTATAQEVMALGGFAFKKSPKDKLKWHALSRIVRFYVPEVLGQVSYLKEEAEDIQDVQVSVIQDPLVFDRLKEQISACKTIEEYEAFVNQISESKNIFTDDEIKELRGLAKEKKLELTVSEADKDLAEGDFEEKTPEEHVEDIQKDEPVAMTNKEKMDRKYKNKSPKQTAIE